MSNIYSSILDLVGNTPLVELTGYEKEHELKAKILGKLEYYNPSGSVKDRASLKMILEAEKSGELQPGGTIIEFTSGNVGIAVAMIANIRGYHYINVLQAGVSQERTQILKAYGAEIYYLNELEGAEKYFATHGGCTTRNLVDFLQDYADEKGYYYVKQFANENNIKAHAETTGPEIWRDTDGAVDYLVQLVGSGGTMIGTGSYLKDQNPEIKVVAAQPAPQSRKDVVRHPDRNTIDGVVAFAGEGDCEAPIFFADHPGSYDEWMDVVAEDAYAAARDVIKTDGLFLGQSAGAALWAATQVAKRPEAEGKNIVVILPDNGFKYLSTNLYQ